MSTDFIGAGWQYPLGVTHGGGMDLAWGTRKLEQSMRLILITYPGERPARPAFGSWLRDFVFMPPTTDNREQLADEVRRAIAAWEHRVEVTSVSVDPDPDDWSLLHIAIAYTVKASGDERNLVFPFYSLPESGGE